MSYCDQDDILEQISESELIDLTDDIGAGSVNDAVLARAIADADAEIDSYCGARYTVPFSPTPLMIRRMSVDIAVWRLFTRRGVEAPGRKEQYDNAIRFLKDVAKGLVTIGADAPAPDDDGGPEASTVESDRTFTLGKISDSSTGTLDNY